MTYDHRLFIQTASEFSRTLVGAYEVEDTLGELVQRTTAILGLAGAGIILTAEDRMRFVTAYSERVAVLERYQEATQAGACIEAFRTGRRVVVEHLASEMDRWPGYSAVAIGLGTNAVVGLPMTLYDETFGALNLYADGPRAWSPDDLAAAEVLADMATAYIVNASRQRQQEQLAEQLQRALDSRVVIEQAKGALAQAEGIAVEHAFQRIRRYARSHGLPLRAVAHDVVAGGLRP